MSLGDVAEQEVHYLAAPSELNDMVVGHEDVSTIHVRDAGATIDAGSGWVSIDANNARCTVTGVPLRFARVETRDMNDRVRSINDPPAIDPHLIANGGSATTS